MLRFANENTINNENTLNNNSKFKNENNNNINISDYLKYSHQNFISPSKYLQEQNMVKPLFGMYTQKFLNPINEEKENLTNEENVNDENTSGSSNNSLNLTDLKSSSKNITYENWVYKIPENKSLKKFYLVLINKDIFYYKDEKKKIS